MAKSRLEIEAENLLQKADAFFTASDNLPKDSFNWEFSDADASKVDEYTKAFNELRAQYITTMQQIPG